MSIQRCVSHLFSITIRVAITGRYSVDGFVPTTNANSTTCIENCNSRSRRDESEVRCDDSQSLDSVQGSTDLRFRQKSNPRTPPHPGYAVKALSNLIN